MSDVMKVRDLIGPVKNYAATNWQVSRIADAIDTIAPRLLARYAAVPPLPVEDPETVREETAKNAATLSKTIVRNNVVTEDEVNWFLSAYNSEYYYEGKHLTLDSTLSEKDLYNLAKFSYEYFENKYPDRNDAKITPIGPHEKDGVKAVVDLYEKKKSVK